MAMAEISHKEVEVRLSSALLQGTISTRHDRLSDHLAISDEFFLLRNARLTEAKGCQHEVRAETVMVYKSLVILVVDLTSGEHHSTTREQLLRVDREAQKVVVGAGPFWVCGDIHLPRGASLETIGLGKSLFLPLTQARFLDRSEAKPATFIINRQQVNSLFIAPKGIT
jgi:hypothetical protein